MNFIKVLALTIFLFSGFYSQGQSAGLDSLNVTHAFQQDVLEVTFKNNNPSTIELSFIIIQDEILHLSSSRMSLTTGQETTIDFQTKSASNLNTTLKVYEICNGAVSTGKSFSFQKANE